MTDKVYNALLNKQLIQKKDVKTKADQIGVRIGFLFDLNFKRSFELLKEKDYINQMIDIQLEEVKNEELKNQLKTLKEFSNKYIEEMITC